MKREKGQIEKEKAELRKKKAEMKAEKAAQKEAHINAKKKRTRSNTKQQFRFKRMYLAHLAELPPVEFKEFMLALCDYCFDGKEPQFYGCASTLWGMLKRMVDRQNDISEKRKVLSYNQHLRNIDAGKYTRPTHADILDEVCISQA